MRFNRSSVLLVAAASVACVLQRQSASAFHLQSPSAKVVGVAGIRARGGAIAPPSTPSKVGAADPSSATKTALKVAAAGAADGSSEEGKGTGTATIPDEVFNLVKSIVGAGVLSLPAGIAAFGNAPSALIPATALVVAIGAISAYTFMLIARVCSITGATSYADAWDKTRGTETSWIIAASSALDCFAGNLSYSMILADTFKSLLATIGIMTTRSNALLGVTGLVLLPLCLVKNLSTLAPFSLVGIMGMVYTSVAIGIRFFGGAYKSPAGRFLPDIAANLQPAFGSEGAMAALSPNSLILICMLSTAYIAHFNAPRFFKELKNNTMKRFSSVTSWSFGISTVMYAAVSAMGFLTFGANADGLILNNYSTKDILISLSRFAVAVSLVFSYPLLFVGTRDGYFDLLKIPDEKRTDALQNKVTVGLLGVLTAMAWKLTDLSFVSSMSGAIFGTALIFVYPSLMFRGAVRKLGDKATAGMKRESKLAGIVNVLGIVIGLIGAKMAWSGTGGH